MYRTTSKIFVYLIIVVASLSCKRSFLEVIPQGYTIATTTADYDLLMNNAAFFKDNEWSPSGLAEVQVMGDEAAASATYFNQGSLFLPRLFQWQDVIYLETDMSPAFLRRSLNSIYTFNKVISEVMASSEGTVQEKAALRAEARACRAFTNFYLINYYAKPYQASTAATDPGFPIVDQADASVVSFNRGTVQEMYDFIINDYKAAIADLPQIPRIRTRFSKPAAEALLGKVYLFMGRNEEARDMFDAAFASLASNQVQLYDYNVTFAPGGSFLPLNPMYGPAGPGNDVNDFTEDILVRIHTSAPEYAGLLNNRGLVLTKPAEDLYDTRDLRLNFYSRNGLNGPADPSGLLRKYGKRYNRYGMQLSELYLLRAEARARTNNLTGAVADLESLRTKRMPAGAATVPSAIAASQPGLIRYVMDERTREFALEGYRWFDMRRLSTDPLYTGISFTHTLYNADGTTNTYTLKQPERLVMRIPAPFINSNPGMVNNP